MTCSDPGAVLMPGGVPIGAASVNDQEVPAIGVLASMYKVVPRTGRDGVGHRYV